MLLTTAEAALRLRVSAHEVRRLITNGDLIATRVGRMLLIEESSIRRRLQSSIGRGRALSPRTAWAALHECSGERATWLDSSTRSRLRRWLRTSDPEKIAQACRRRVDRHDLRSLPIYLPRIIGHDGVRAGGMTAAGSTQADIVSFGEQSAEIYCHPAILRSLIGTFGLSSEGDVNLVVRVPRLTTPDVLDRPTLPQAAIAVDLLESTDVRSRRAGTNVLQQQLDEHLG